MLLSTLSRQVAYVVGAAYLCKLLFSLVRIFYRYFVYKTDWKSKWGADTKDTWAVVTGCTDGIGREYALQLAQKGYSILLVARNSEKLAAVAAEIGATGGRSEFLVLDFGIASKPDYDRYEDAIKNKRIRVLVNNVGVSYPFPEYLHLQTEQVLADLQTVNMQSMLNMTRITIPKMLQGFKLDKGRSLVLNLGSFSRLGAPLLGAYAGSKGFVHSLSKSLRADYAPLGVDVVDFHPLFIATKMAKMRASLLAPSPKRWAATSLRVANDKSASGGGGCLLHDLAYFVLQLLPDWLIQRQSLAMHRGLRARAYKKFAMEDPMRRK